MIKKGRLKARIKRYYSLSHYSLPKKRKVSFRFFNILPQIFSNEVPIDHMEKILQICTSIISRINIIGMLSHIYSEKDFYWQVKRILSVRHIQNF